MRLGMFGGCHTRPFSGTPADVKLKTAGISKCSTMGRMGCTAVLADMS
jgi:hypothetical protein